MCYLMRSWLHSVEEHSVSDESFHMECQEVEQDLLDILGCRQSSIGTSVIANEGALASRDSTADHEVST